MRAAMKKRLEKIEEEARKTFGEDHGSKWMRSPSRYFQGKTPLEFASDPEQADAVLEHVNHYRGALV